MIIFLSDTDSNEIRVQARFEGDGDMIGDMMQVVQPGESFGGVSFEQLSKLGPGEHEIDPEK